MTKAEHEVTYDSTTVIPRTVTATLFNPDGVSQTVSLRYRALSMPDYESSAENRRHYRDSSVAFVLVEIWTLGTQYLVQVSLDDSFETGVLQTGFTTLDVPDEPESGPASLPRIKL